MDHAWELNASVTPPAPPVSIALGYPSETGTPTVPGAWWFHMITEEMRNAILAGGLTPAYSGLNQLTLAIQNMIEANSGNYSLDTGSANAYVVSLNPAISAYNGNFSGSFKAANGCTGASTLNAGGGVIPLVNDQGGALGNGDIVAGGIVAYNYIHADNKAYITSMVQSQSLDPSLFYKPWSFVPAVVFTKTAGTGVQALTIAAGTSVMVAGVKVNFATTTAVVLPALVAGTDYAIYVCTDGSIRADSSFSAPTGYTTANSRLIGGFHYGLTPSGTTVAGGSFATTGNGMIWTQAEVDLIAGINAYSLWDLKFRPKSDPRGMALVNGMVWVDIYLCSTNPDANGTSKYNTNIASGTVLPVIPAAFGGNGAATYPSMNWWVANEMARSQKKRMMWEHEFVDAAFGVTENQSIDAVSSTYPTTLRNAGYTSKYGIEQATGHQQTWGQDSNFYSEVASPAGSWHDFNGNNGAGTGRGEDYTFGTWGLVRVVLGGCRTNGALSGSRTAFFGLMPSGSSWYDSLRACCDHMISL